MVHIALRMRDWCESHLTLVYEQHLMRYRTQVGQVLILNDKDTHHQLNGLRVEKMKGQKIFNVRAARSFKNKNITKRKRKTKLEKPPSYSYNVVRLNASFIFWKLRQKKKRKKREKGMQKYTQSRDVKLNDVKWMIRSSPSTQVLGQSLHTNLFPSSNTVIWGKMFPARMILQDNSSYMFHSFMIVLHGQFYICNNLWMLKSNVWNMS